MTPEEMKLIEDRLQSGRAAQLKVLRIGEAIKKIKDSNVQRINIAIQPEYQGCDAIVYSEETEAHSKKWFRVCWADEHLPGICAEIHEAIMKILERRLESAIEGFEGI